MSNIPAIFKNEFTIIARNPIVIVIAVITSFLAIINLAGYVYQSRNDPDPIGTFYAYGLGNMLFSLSVIFAFFSMCIGITSLTNEKMTGTLRLLVTKPIYRREIILGKFLGISVFILLFIALVLSIYTSLLIMISGPNFVSDVLAKVCIWAIMLFINCCLILGIVLLFGIILNKYEAMVLSLIFISFEWLLPNKEILLALGDLKIIDPMALYINAMGGDEFNIFTMLPSVSAWFNFSFPYIILNIAEVIIVILITCTIFNQEEM